VTKRYVVGMLYFWSGIVDEWPPASRRDLTDPVIGPERGKPDILRRWRKADRKERRWEAG